MPFRVRLFRLLAAAFAGVVSLASCSGGGSSAGLPATPSAKWVAAWGAAMQPASAASLASGSANQTFRTIMKPTVGSRGTVRVHLSNRYGTAPVTVNALHVGIATSSGPSIVPTADVAFTFSGKASVTIPAGGAAYSDAMPLSFGYGSYLAATIYVAGPTNGLPQHGAFGQIIDYASPSGSGAEMTDYAGTSFVASTTNALLDHVDVLGDYAGTVAIAGSSTSAGFGVPSGSYAGMVDEVAQQLHDAGRDDLAIANMSIVPDSLIAANDQGGNPSVLERLQTDFLSLPGLRTIVQNAADIDLKAGKCDTAADIVAGDRSLIAQAHAAGVRVVLAVVAPATYCNGQTPNGFGSRFTQGSGQDGERDRLNAWIVSTDPSTVDGVAEAAPEADGVVDLATPVADPTNTGYLLPLYDVGDDSHVTAAGQLLQARAIAASAL